MINFDEILDELIGESFDNDGDDGTIEDAYLDGNGDIEIETNEFSTTYYVSDDDDDDNIVSHVIEYLEEEASERNNDTYRGYDDDY